MTDWYSAQSLGRIDSQTQRGEFFSGTRGKVLRQNDCMLQHVVENVHLLSHETQQRYTTALNYPEKNNDGSSHVVATSITIKQDKDHIQG